MNDSANMTFSERAARLAELLQERFGEAGCTVVQALGEVTMTLPRERLIEIATRLRDGAEFRFEQVIDVCGVDYADYGRAEWATGNAVSCGYGRGVERSGAAAEADTERFAAVYHLLSVSLNQRLRLRVLLDSEQPLVPSVVGIWSGANWFEREAFDLYGILFEGHPDLRRILTDYGFVGHPFRKDFPLEGTVEMRYDLEKQRVVYEPVSIEPRTLVPKVIREDNRYLAEQQPQQDSSDA